MDYFVHLYKYAVKIQIAYMYTNTFKNEVTTDQKGKLLLNMCGILFYCRNGEKSTAIKRMQTVQGSFLRVFFMPPKELWEAYSNRTVRLSVRPSVSPSVPLSCPVHISYIL